MLYEAKPSIAQTPHKGVFPKAFAQQGKRLVGFAAKAEDLNFREYFFFPAMQCSLNFSEDSKPVLKFLRQFPALEAKSGHELLRCRIGESTATLYKSGKLLLQGNDCERAKQLVLKALEKEEEAIIGIDEAGRGEGFGPFVVAGVLGKASALRELRDSKKTRNIEKAMALVEKNALGIAVSRFSAEELSRMHEEGKTLNQVEADAIKEICAVLQKGALPKVVVDGSPFKGAPKGVSFLVRGDDLNPVVGAASVAARYFRLKSGDKAERKGWGNWQAKGKGNEKLKGRKKKG